MNLSSLNEQQKAAVMAPLGPVLVLAGAGSGKTRVLSFRIAYLIEKALVKSENILALTFTNKAAAEMQKRVVSLLSRGKSNAESKKSTQDNLNFQLSAFNSSALPSMGTFHSLGARILRKEIARLGYNSNFVIIDSSDQLKIIKDILHDLPIETRLSPNLFRAYISTAKNNLQTPQELSLGLEADLANLVQEVYLRYQNFLSRQNSVDFDDLLMLPIKLFQANETILAKYQKQFRYILVDEYQDTNHAQYVLLYLLAVEHNIFVVGDDAQSIYGFRGSNIGNILNFEKHYPEAKVYKLEQNYRSTKNILTVAQKVIELNPEQKPKTLWTENPAGSKVQLEAVEDELGEAYFVAKTIVALSSGLEIPEPASTTGGSGFSILDQFLRKQSPQSAYSFLQLPKQHGSLKGFAVLYRTHAQSRALEEAFISAAIPYQIIGGVKFYERREIKDVLAYLRLLSNPFDLLSLKRVVNVPARGIGEKSFQALQTFIDSVRSTIPEALLPEFLKALSGISLPAKSKQAVSHFYELLDGFNSLAPEIKLSELMKAMVKKVQLFTWYNDGTEIGEVRVENIKELFNVAVKFDHLPWPEGLPQFLEEVALISEVDNLKDNQDTVTLMTLHAAKGLEFDTVFFVGLEEGILPHAQSLLNPAELSEEIRLAYVGLTRAKKQLFLLYAKARRLYGNLTYTNPSRILRVIPAANLSGSLGQSLPYAEPGELTYEPLE